MSVERGQGEDLSHFAESAVDSGDGAHFFFDKDIMQMFAVLQLVLSAEEGQYICIQLLWEAVLSKYVEAWKRLLFLYKKTPKPHTHILKPHKHNQEES